MTRPIACNLDVFTPEQRVRHSALYELIFPLVTDRVELANGYAYHLPLDVWGALAEWALLERMCCPFLDFRLDLQADDVLLLSLTGPEGVKTVLTETDF
jgi:hypothetical protein